ncbi:MAG: response regulator transcription factor [Anaerolineales bacterium]
MKTITILLADDHKLVRQGLRTMLEARPDLQVIGEAADGIETLELAARLNPDVILLDVMMPHLNGIEAGRQIRQRGIKSRIVFLSMHANAGYAVRALHSGALGYVIKDADFSEILQAIYNAAEGRRYLSAEIADEVLELLLSNGGDKAGSLDILTPRERQILQLIAEGNTNTAIANKLTLSVRTVEAHRARLMAKLRLRSHAELIRFAIQQGLIET